MSSERTSGPFTRTRGATWRNFVCHDAGITPRFLIYGFLTDPGSSILGVWATPGGRETFQKGGGAKPPTFLEGIPAAPKIDDLRSVKKSYIKNLGVCHDSGIRSGPRGWNFRAA